jgi:hypothetical protein
MEYYVEGVSHEFVLFDSYKTTLTVSRGQYLKGGLFAQGLRGPFYFGDKDPEPEAISTSKIAKQTLTGQPAPAVKTLSPTGFVRLPDGVGYKYVGSENARYCTPETAKKIQKIGEEWDASHPGGQLGINDMSRADGGPVPPHSAHRSGNEVDIRPINTADNGGPCIIGQADYSQPLTKDLVTTVYSNGGKSILFNDTTVGAVKPYAKHSNHLHVNFA